MGAVSGLGLVLGLCAFLVTFAPSLLPRRWLMQGLIGGVVAVIGLRLQLGFAAGPFLVLCGDVAEITHVLHTTTHQPASQAIPGTAAHCAAADRPGIHTHPHCPLPVEIPVDALLVSPLRGCGYVRAPWSGRGPPLPTMWA